MARTCDRTGALGSPVVLVGDFTVWTRACFGVWFTKNHRIIEDGKDHQVQLLSDHSHVHTLNHKSATFAWFLNTSWFCDSTTSLQCLFQSLTSL